MDKSSSVQVEAIRKILGTKPKRKKRPTKAAIRAGRESSTDEEKLVHNWAPRGETTGKTKLNTKLFEVFDEVTRKKIGHWYSISDCCKELGLNYGHVLSCLRGDRHRHEGYTFKYNNEVL